MRPLPLLLLAALLLLPAAAQSDEIDLAGETLLVACKSGDAAGVAAVLEAHPEAARFQVEEVWRWRGLHAAVSRATNLCACVAGRVLARWASRR